MKVKKKKIKIYHLKIILIWSGHIINDHKTPEVLKVHSGKKVTDYETTLGERKIQLKMSINLISSKDDSDEIRKMHTKSHNVVIMMANEADKIIEELFESFLQNYRKYLEEPMKGSGLIFDSADLLY